MSAIGFSELFHMLETVYDTITLARRVCSWPGGRKVGLRNWVRSGPSSCRPDVMVEKTGGRDSLRNAGIV